MVSLLMIACVVALACLGTVAHAALPPEVDLTPRFREFGLDARSQGARDTCSLFAITAVANFECCAAGRAGERLSEEFLVWAANSATGLTGDQAMFYEAVHGLNALGICTEQQMPYQSGGDASRRPSEQALADAKTRAQRWRVHWLRRWNVETPLTDAEFGAIKNGIADGHPVACGLRWPSGQSGCDIVDVPPPDRVYDGHSIVLTGYRDDSKLPGGGSFTFRNHAGPGWGNGGYGTMSYAYVRAYVNDALSLELGKRGSEDPVERYEAETMTVKARDRCETAEQSMRPYGGGMWSGHRQLMCHAEEGGSIELSFRVEKAGRYRVRALATAAPDYGTVRAQLDGKPAGGPFDLYSGRVSPAGSLELGTHELAAGEHTLRFTVIGKHPASQGYSFGLDAIDLLIPDR